MVRVMHLSGREPDFQGERSMAGLRRDLGGDFEVLDRRIGRGGDFRNAWSAGLALRSRAAEPVDLIHAWDDRALLAAAIGAKCPVVYTPREFPSPRHVRWVRAVLGHRDVHVACPTATMRRLFVERGVSVGRCHLVRPGVEFGRVRRRRDPALRAAMGLADSDYVMLACGESTPAAAHDVAVWAASFLHVIEPRHKLLVWGRGPEARAVGRMGPRFAQPDLVRLASERLGRAVEFEELLPAADAVLVTATDPVPTLPIAICMAAGLPIIATVTYTVAELLEDRHTAVMVTARSARQVARRVLELHDDPQLQWSISDMARTEAYEFFAHTRFADQHRTLYKQAAAGGPVEIPEPQPGAGQRFHGRVA